MSDKAHASAERLSFTEVEAVRMLGISRSTLHRARARREIGFYRIGRTVRYSLEHLRAYLARTERSSFARVTPRTGKEGYGRHD